MLPIFDKKIIADYNAEGFDSVEGEDFEPGFGGVLPDKKVILKAPPKTQPLNWTENDQENYEYEHREYNEILQQEDEFLKSHGIS